MLRFNIGEARSVRDHNIDRKKLPLGGRWAGPFISLQRGREHDVPMIRERPAPARAAPIF
jgi:hypothetical protein